MSALSYLVAAASENTDFSSLSQASPSVRPNAASHEDLQYGRRRHVYGDDADLESPPSPSSPSSCAFSTALQTVLTDRLPNWGSLLPSFPRLHYWITSLSLPAPSSSSSVFPLPSSPTSSWSHQHSWHFNAPSRQGAQPENAADCRDPDDVVEVRRDGGRNLTAYLAVAAGDDVRAEGWAAALCSEAWLTARGALPLLASSALQFSTGVSSLAIVGQLGLVDLAAVGLAMALTRVTGHVILMGLGSALGVLYSQAVVLRRPALQAVYLLRSLLVLSAACVPLSAVWLCGGALLSAMQQPPPVAALAGRCCRAMLAALPSAAWSLALSRFLQLQGTGAQRAMDLCAAATLFVHVPATWYFVHTAGLGAVGAAVAVSLSSSLHLLLLCICTWRSPSFSHLQMEDLWSSEPLHDVDHYLRLALPSTVMACMETWGVHAIIPMAGLLSSPELDLSVVIILLYIFFFAFTVAFGFGASLSSRVAVEMAAGRPRAAQQAAAVGVALSGAVGLGLGLPLLAPWLGLAVARLFTPSSAAGAQVAALMPVLAVAVALDTLQEALIGVLRGCGKQTAGACITLAGDALGLASAAYLAFARGIGLTGLLVGMAVGIASQTLALAALLLSSDWADQAVKVIRRVESHSEGLFRGGVAHPLLE